uniref:Uncharacterized protein n=1 Tax=Schizaphis graminum TaxID=13262 RepID=A0A2S2NWP9_SCHGA
MDMSGRSALAKFAVQLVVLWQFGGTVLDDGVVVVRGDVYRATSSAVEYGDRTISSPIACHAFVYEAMLSVKKYALGGEPFAPDTGRTILDGTATVVEALSVADWVMCRGGVAVDDHCYYEEATAESIGYRCPVAADEPPSPEFQETIIRATSPKFRKPVDPAIKTTNTAAAEDGQNRNTTDDERISAVI